MGKSWNFKVEFEKAMCKFCKLLISHAKIF